MWNLWHGCRKTSPGCQNCYVYRADARYGRDSSVVAKTKSFDLPIRKDRLGGYKAPPARRSIPALPRIFFWRTLTNGAPKPGV